jgi:hypothetical protein
MRDYEAAEAPLAPRINGLGSLTIRNVKTLYQAIQGIVFSTLHCG